MFCFQNMAHVPCFEFVRPINQIRGIHSTHPFLQQCVFLTGCNRYKDQKNTWMSKISTMVKSHFLQQAYSRLEPVLDHIASQRNWLGRRIHPTHACLQQCVFRQTVISINTRKYLNVEDIDHGEQYHICNKCGAEPAQGHVGSPANSQRKQHGLLVEEVGFLTCWKCSFLRLLWLPLCTSWCKPVFFIGVGKVG